MQPVPQAVPAGAGGPPPLATSRNTYWRNGPFGRRANVQVSAAAGPVQPVTDPFVFGRKAPESSSLSNAPKDNMSKGNLPPVPDFSPVTFPPPSTPQPPNPYVGDKRHGSHPALQTPASQPGANGTFSNMADFSPALTAHITTNSDEMHLNIQRGVHNPQESHSTGIALENSVGGHPGLTSVIDRPVSGQEISRTESHPSCVPTSLSYFPSVPQCKPIEGRNYSPYPEPLFSNAFYAMAQSTVGISQPGHQHHHNPQQPVVQNPMQAPSMFGDAPSVSAAHSGVTNAAWQNAGAANPWQGQLPPEHFYLQPLETAYSLGSPITQENNPASQTQGTSEGASGQSTADADSGTVSMFFKGHEAENEEIVSSEKVDPAGRADLDAFQQTMGHTYYQPLHAQQISTTALSQAQVTVSSSVETLQKGIDNQHSPRAACVHHDFVASKDTSVGGEEPHGHVGLSYENIENLECVQNQEVLPSELPPQSHASPGAVPDLYKYASLSGPPLPKNSIVSHIEGGPNLEAPDSLPQPVRPDSVSSNYSNFSHRSVSSSTRPQELGTFIQQESGKPEEDSVVGFFKQIDSSPLGADASKKTPIKSYHSSLSQVPTPSPPKPTGVFQTSANSSFEPVRSHGLGVKPTEVDQAKMVVERRETRPSQRSTKKSPAMPVASPGNLEQPPDNLETIFMARAQTLPLIVPGDTTGGSTLDNIPSVLEKRVSTRAQGTVKKCESPATTLWAPSELPNFEGNVVLAPAAPVVYVAPKQVVQPPDEGLPIPQQPHKLGADLHPPLQAGQAASENLENPPQMGNETAHCSQASSSYASLLSSPPTEALQNQPILITQANQSYHLAQPANFSLANQLSKNENNHMSKDPVLNNKPLLGRHNSGDSSGENGLAPGSLATTLTNASLFQAPFNASEMALNKTAPLLVPPASQVPLNLASEGPKTAPSEGLPPQFETNPSSSHGPASSALASSTAHAMPNNSHSSRLKNGSSGQESSGALDFTLAKNLERSLVTSGMQGSLAFPQAASHATQVGPEVHDQQHFYQQVTKDMQPPVPSDNAAPLQQQTQGSSVSQIVPPQLPPNHALPPGSNHALAPSNRSFPAGPLEESFVPLPTNYIQTNAVLGPPSSAVGTAGLPPAPTSAKVPSSQQGQQPPQNTFGPPPNPYYYYGHPYDAYASAYQPPYPPVDPRTAHLYYQENAYSRYDPAYRQYDSSTTYGDPASYRYTEPERPSSRASHTSDRPSSRQGYPDDYYNTKSGWSDYYANYYANPYDYGDPSRWDRYQSAYDARFRDPRGYDQRYWYDTEHNSYLKREPYSYKSSQDRYEDHWRYDPRFTGSFDDDLEPRRDPYGDEFDRRSVHSEHSGHSLRSSHSVHSRQSSFSSRSQQSQLYRSNHDLTANAYGTTNQPTSLHTDYSYGGYTNFESQPPFTDYSYSAQTSWPTIDQAPSRPLTPEKFSVPHVCARFGPGGYLVKVLPNLPSEGQPALVEIHNMEMMLQNFSEQEEMRAFPGPLTKDDTHKVDVINFAQNKASRCFQNNALIDKDSAQLLWDFVVLLCRQNGTVVGTDIAELLLRDHKTVWLPGKSPNEANLIDFTNEALEQAEEESGEAQLSFLTDSLITTIDSLEKETERFRELLLYGRKKDALESAMKHGLWGHALLLASKMDSRTHARVMTRFANSLPMNDPLQTVYQLMSGRMPAAATCCGQEKWGDWRPHLAMVLSNLTSSNMDVESRTITTMGDTLASKGLLDAAHFCYLMAQVGFGVYTKKTTKLVLIGSNHSLPFLKFATNEAIQRTEAYEYAQSLGTQPCSLPNFQVFKFIYACRLAEMGLSAQAFHYCEVISKAVLQSPCFYSPVLISQLIQISSQLRLFDPRIKEISEQESVIEPNWLTQLRNLDGQIKEGSIAYSTDRATPQQYACSTPNSELDHVSQYEVAGAGPEGLSSLDNPLLASLLPGTRHPVQSVQLMPSAPQTIIEGSAGLVPPSQQEAATTAPYYPVTSSSVGPGPSGFPNPYGAEQAPMYLGTTVPAPPPQMNEQPQEQVNQEAVGQSVSQESAAWKAVPEPREDDFYGKMANMGSGRRSRSASQSSAHMGFGRRSRTTSESSVHSIGRERRTSAAQQPSSPCIPERKETKAGSKKEPAPRKSGATWFGWLMGKGRNEAHLPDDKNKSIVWDEKKQRWVNLDEPEEESKPPPPPPTAFPKAPQAAPSGPGGPPGTPVNMFSRRAAGSRARYVDILNPSGAKSPGTAAPAPSDLFAPLAPMPIPANMFVPNSVPEEQQPLEGRGAEQQMAPGNQTIPEVAPEVPYLNSATLPTGSELPPSNPEGSQSGELSRSSSMSSLSREVSQHFNQPPAGGPPVGTVQFYNPSQFAQSAPAPGSSRLGRIGQRKYPTLK